MPKFFIYSEHSLGFSHSGEVTAEGEGYVELSEEEVQKLVSLIKDNKGETDVEKLDLANKYPDIYEKLDSAYSEAAYKAEYNHWVIAGYENGWYEVDTNEAIALCRKNYGFSFEYDEDKYREDYGLDPDEEIDENEYEDAVDYETGEAFEEWVEEYRASLDEDAEVEFLSTVFGLEPEVVDYNYEVEIPNEIIDMATKR